MEEVSEIIGLQVYTKNGIFLGTIDNLILDVEKAQIHGLFIRETNPLLVEGARSVSVPYRWVKSVGDVILLRYFPTRVTIKKEAPVDEDLIE
jgi:sporulation protein YlmC with PRC-barrel domain